jgi:hypothetical protein
MSTIFATRRGFLYQDVYAVLQFLKHFQSKQITEFYVDFVFDEANQGSIDIKIVLVDGTTKIVEVKSGENFKQDKRKKDTSEVREAFIELAECSRLDNEILKSFVLSPEFKGKPKIFEYWQNLVTLKTFPTFQSADAKRISKWFYLKLSISQFSTHESAFDFIKNLEIECSDNDVHDNENDHSSPLEDSVIQKIRDLSEDFGVDGTDQELPCKMLFAQMVYTCQKHAGTNKNLYETLTDLILRFFSQRRMINRPASRDFPTVYEDVKRFYSTWRTQTSATIMPAVTDASVAEVTEGGTINE